MDNTLHPLITLAAEAQKVAAMVSINAHNNVPTTHYQAGNAAAVSDMANIALEYVTHIVAERDKLKARVVEVEAGITPPVPLTAATLADAFDAMWNGALNEAVNQQAGMDTASILASGFQAMAYKLRHPDNVG